MPDLFSDAGIAAWRARLEHSEAFRRAARGWSGTVLLVERNGSGASRRTFVAVDDGTLRASRAATEHDAATAEFVLQASAETWGALVTGKAELLTSALTGALRMERGSVMRLIPHVGAAAAMLREAGGR